MSGNTRDPLNPREDCRKTFCPAIMRRQILILGFACGIATIRWPLAGVVSLAVMIVVYARSWRPVFFWAVVLLCFAGGYWYAGNQSPNSTDQSLELPSEKVQLSGKIRSVTGRPGKRWQVVLEDAAFVQVPGASSQRLDGGVVWYWHHAPFRPRPGQFVTFQTSLNRVSGFGNPGAWDYGWYWRAQGVEFSAYCSGMKHVSFDALPDSVLGDFRDTLRRNLLSITPEGQGRAMLLALLMGDRFELAPSTINLMRQAGLSHTLALSGLHLGFVASLGLILAWGIGALFPRIYLWIPRPKLAVLLAAPLVAGYVWLGQATPSLVRASLMFAFWGGLLVCGRGRILLDGLFLAVLCILLISPLALFDIRFQLSVVAVSGIALLYPFVHSVLPRGDGYRRIAAWAVGLLGVSLCASVALLPVTAHLFGMITPNLLMNLFWLPLLGLVVMPLGMAGMMLGVVSWASPVAGVLLTSAAMLLEWMLGVVEAVGAAGMLPMWRLLRPLWPEMLGAAVVLICFILFSRDSRFLRWPVLLLGLLLLWGPHWWVGWEDASPEVRLEVLDVGQGQALLIRLPGGGRALVDGGGLRSRTLEVGRDVVAPYLTLGRPPRIGTIVLTHPHMDHYKGLVHLLEFFQVKKFFHTGHWPGGHWGDEMQALLKQAGIVPQVVRTGMRIVLAPEVELFTLMPPKGEEPPSTNDESVVLLLRWQGRNLALLPGDAEEWSLRQMVAMERDYSCPVLVLPHHGSATGVVPEFYERVSPKLGLCSCGRYGRTPLPAPELLVLPAMQRTLVADTATYGLLRVSWSRPDAHPNLTVGRPSRNMPVDTRMVRIELP
ncbi:competence protein ComEC [Paucidesulfovibrio gracilis DSM 16080]|uniref:Competence protein ComEC n=2 Tax=Paucidesulfovibrio TaxID=2910985 RepID=A0A1T4WKI3_9BACT|nr:competence protein ComEC [Paucidesulfovibrio gracilis DSM 16080]